MYVFYPKTGVNLKSLFHNPFLLHSYGHYCPLNKYLLTFYNNQILKFYKLKTSVFIIFYYITYYILGKF